MRKTLLAGSVAAAALLSTSAFAQPVDYYNQADYYAPAAAAVTGTVVGLGFSEGWWSAGGAHRSGWRGRSRCATARSPRGPTASTT